MSDVMAEGDALLKRLDDRQKEREMRRRDFVVVNVPLRRHADGVVSTQSISVPRSSLPKGK
ncbi:hypothetical protein [Oricola sp.]|uniref:hypothetical protein n=1 Tax=Oricola sp. TaxID=1979950 RepID=UPI0025F6D663|nr:hypothetical protein [Oricola sp.]MCI5073955.1 hypothetical protein [Oricola sp.]